MPMYAYDGDGRITNAVIGSPTWQATKEQMGFSVLETDEIVKREDYYIVGGRMAPKAGVVLTPDKAEIAAEDQDRAVVAVRVAVKDPPASIQIEVDGVPVEVHLADGQGQLPPITSPLEHVFSIRVSDQVKFNDNGGCVVAAEEQE